MRLVYVPAHNPIVPLERDAVREVLEGMLIKHDAERWMRGKQAVGVE